MRTPSDNRKGQALLMVTLSLLAMFGIMGLAVDVGWSYFVRKSAQAAADSAALAAAQAALASFENAGVLDSSTVTVTGGPVKCPDAAGNLSSGCTYALQNGFPKTAAQTVTMEADLGAVRPPSTAPGIPTDYWVTTRVQENIPQLFSAIMGNPTGRSGARATAAIVEVDFPGALILLNRQRDCIAMNGPSSTVCGVNLDAQGSSFIRAKSGILMASTRHGEDLGIPKDNTQWAGHLGGSATVKSDFTGIRGDGKANVTQTDPSWDKPWQNGLPDSSYFRDPMSRIKQQPPPPPASLGLEARQVVGCQILGGTDAASAVKLLPGKYYSVKPPSGVGGCQDGDPIQINGYVEFLSDGSGFANYTFFGGMRTIGPNTNLTFSPGRYVFAGVKPKSGVAGDLFDASLGQLVMQDQTPLNADGQSQANTDPGELLIFTDATYPGLDTSGVPASALSGLDFGTSGFQTGNNKDNVIINLHGLNADATGVPSDLKDFAPVVLWQDQRNSVTKYYDESGNKLMNCIIGDQGYGSACANTLAHENSPMLTLQASPSVHLYGIVYQPRGAWTSLVGGAAYAGPMRVITGAISLQGGADLDLTALKTPMRLRTVALIE